jgi:uncharacterized membrane protein (UPF0127 family)
MRDDSNVLRRVSLAVILALTGCSSQATSVAPAGDEVEFGDGAATLTVEVADTPTARARGLMGVESLPPDHGMVFIWGTLEDAAFWMKDTLIPLSIAFVGDDDRIHTILEMEPCETEPCRTYEARRPYVMAVEANAGWFQANGIEVGDTADLMRAP